jgi:hypothetical protein
MFNLRIRTYRVLPELLKGTEVNLAFIDVRILLTTEEAGNSIKANRLENCCIYF